MLICGSRKLVIDIDNYIQNHEVSMIAGAVTYDCSNSFLHQFQQLDLASLQGAIGSFGIGKVLCVMAPTWLTQIII
jgi:hypothetical protein